jgi:DNA-binding MarR family transcriptional regulator
MSSETPVDLSDPEQLQLALRIGLSWIELRRGAAMSTLRDHLFGTGDDALEQGQMDTLDLLAQRRSMRMSELADALRVDPSTATRAVQRLVNVGLASRMASDEDGRVVMVAITEAGRQRHADVAERRSEVMTHVLGDFEPAERHQLADLLERFIGSVDDFVAQLDS